MEVTKKTFHRLLNKWGELGSRLPVTGIGLTARLLSVILVYLRFEEIGFYSDRDKEPYSYMVTVLENQLMLLNNLFFFIEKKDLFFAEDSAREDDDMVKRHKGLWQNLFNRYSEDGYETLVHSMTSRFETNGIAGDVSGKRCLDIGCGGGRQCVCFSRLGADLAIGIDFGEANIRFACRMKKQLKIENITYQVADAENLPFGGNVFDIVSSNGVFHHLESMDRAVAETFRVLKPGGWMWLYVNGAGGMFHRIMDTMKVIMKDTDRDTVLDYLRQFRMNEHKMYHLMDVFYATYKYTRWDDLAGLLRTTGFKRIRRLSGTISTDFNLNKIRKDPYGEEKFGEGEIRLIAFK